MRPGQKVITLKTQSGFHKGIGTSFFTQFCFLGVFFVFCFSLVSQMDEQFLRNLASTFSGQSFFKHAQSDTHLIWLTVSLYSCPLLKTVTLWLPACHRFRGNLWTLATKITCLHFPQMGTTLVSQGHLLLWTGFWEIWQISSSNTTLQGTLMTPHPQCRQVEPTLDITVLTICCFV